MLKIDPSNRVRVLIIFNMALALFIILWGAWVRLSGSGAGCGEHWPLCHGEVLPMAPSYKTLIELTHRLTSGIFGITVLAQTLFAFKDYGKKHPEFKASCFFLILTIIEALIGAVLVKKGLVDRNESALRAWVIGAHLINTLLLLGAGMMSFLFSRLPMGLKKREAKSWEKILTGAGLILFLVVGAFGAIAALGGTLFPSDSLAAGMAMDFDPEAPFLIRLRIYHPVLAIMLGICWTVLLISWKERLDSCLFVPLSFGLLYLTIGFGVVNWLLMAPTWGALGHLLTVDLLWLSLVGACFHRYFLIPASSCREPRK